MRRPNSASSLNYNELRCTGDDFDFLNIFGIQILQNLKTELSSEFSVTRSDIKEYVSKRSLPMIS